VRLQNFAIQGSRVPASKRASESNVCAGYGEDSTCQLDGGGIVIVGTPARADGAAGLVLELAFQLLQIKPSYVVRVVSSAWSSKFTVPILTKISVPVLVPSVPLALLLEDLVVGALVDIGPLVDFQQLVPGYQSQPNSGRLT
jgi:hypothetical protein